MTSNDEYQLIDSGYGRKLERFGAYTLDRPCSQAVWMPQLPQRQWNELAHGSFSRENGNHWNWRGNVPKSWHCRLEGITFLIQPTDFGHVGIFPEHAFGWRQLPALTAHAANEEINVLNLFAYSGGATFAAAKSGCKVCHLDASKKMMDWARENAKLNNLEDSIRWITDDVQKFLQREIRRGRKYQGIILDPPSFGRGTNQEVFQIDNSMLTLLKLCNDVLADDARFILLSCHTPGYTPTVLTHLMNQSFPAGKVSAGEMLLAGNKNALDVPSGAYALWKK